MYYMPYPMQYARCPIKTAISTTSSIYIYGYMYYIPYI